MPEPPGGWDVVVVGAGTAGCALAARLADTGRREDLVISGGVNVYPAEVEAVLDAHPDVVESAVFGVPDEEWGQRVVAAYVGAAEPADLGTWARERLAAAKRPKSLHRLDDLPRTSTGKVRRLDLPELLRRHGELDGA